MSKKYIQSCNIGMSMYGKSGGAKRGAFRQHVKVEKKDIVDVYNKFYKDQVNALYKALHRGRAAS